MNWLCDMRMNSPNITEADLAEIVKRSKPRTVHTLPKDPESKGGRPPSPIPAAARAQIRNETRKAERRAAKAARIKVSEHSHQVAVMQWWAVWARTKGLDERLLVAVPNAQKFMSEARNIHAAYASAKAEGLRLGYPDLVLDIATDVFHGMRIELKTEGGRVSIEQREYADLLRRQGYNVITAWGAGEAIRAIIAYCKSMPLPKDTPNAPEWDEQRPWG